jgi:hypothetical protein
MLRQASEENALGKANLGDVYAEGGFLLEADQLARAALKTEDERARARASQVLQRTSEQRKKEQELEEAIISRAEEERRFRVRYAEVFCTEQSPNLSGSFRLHLGTVDIRQEGTRIAGKYQHSEDVVFPSLTSIFNQSGMETAKKTTTIAFEATLFQGRAGQFRLEKIERTDSALTLLGAASKDYHANGLLIVSKDSASFELLNEADNPCELWTATKLDEMEISS